jgi:hypothetical protein
MRGGSDGRRESTSSEVVQRLARVEMEEERTSGSGSWRRDV